MRKMMSMSSKGQITLPLEVRESLGLIPGDTVVFTVLDGGVHLTPKSIDFNELAGLLGKPPAGTATLEEIDESVASAAGQAITKFETDIKDDAA